MKLIIEKPPILAIEFKKILSIKDAFVLGIFIFLKMEMAKDEYNISVIRDNIIKHFNVSEEKIVAALEVIIEELELVQTTKKEE